MEEIDLRELFNIFWSKKIWIIFITILFALIGVFYTNYMTTPDYKATSTLVLTKNNKDNSSTITQSEVTLNQQLVATYTELIKTNNVLREVIQNLKYRDILEDELKANIEVNLISSTQLIEISVKNADAQKAKDLTNEVVKVFIEREKDIYKLGNIQVVDEAKLPTGPYNINHKKDVLMFTSIGFIIAIGGIFIASLFDTTIKNGEEVEKRLGLTVLASIPQYDYEMKRKGRK